MRRMLPLPLRVAIASALGLVSAAASARADLEPRIVNGLVTDDYATVGALLEGGDPASAGSWCSGTLIGCDTFLTAAHCVCSGAGTQCQPPNAPDPSAYTVFLAHAGVFAVQSITVRPDYAFPVADVAIVKLAAPVVGIRPSEIATTQAPASGTSGTIVGFGRSGGSSFDYGIERYGAVTTGACPPLVSSATSVCWTFDAPLGPAGTDSNTCNGDSGGPLFVDFGAGPVIAGVTSGGTGTSCLPLDRSYDASVFAYRDWILGHGGADLALPVCGGLPPVGDAATATHSFQGTVSATAPEGRASFTVPDATPLLRVSMNAADDGVANFDLYLKQGSPPTTASFDCARIGAGQFGVCEVSNPAAGTWHLLVRRVAGSGLWQSSATSFGASRLRVDLDSAVTSVVAGDPFPFTLALDNHAEGPQRFSLHALLVLPNGVQVPLVAGASLALPEATSVAPAVELPLPATAPRGAFALVAVLVQGDDVVSQDVLGFEVR